MCSWWYFNSRPGSSPYSAGRTRCRASQGRYSSCFSHYHCNPEYRHLLGIWWGNDISIDMTFPFGLRSLPKIFISVAHDLEWIFRYHDVSYCTRYTNDFLTVGKSNSAECRSYIQDILETCEGLGIPLKADKLEASSTILTILGITLDTISMEFGLPCNSTVLC